MRLIDANELKKFFKARMALWPGVDDVLDKISDAPTIEIDLVRHGKWINHGSFVTCSVCNEEQYGIDTGRFYCQNCGAKMDMGMDYETD